MSKSAATRNTARSCCESDSFELASGAFDLSLGLYVPAGRWTEEAGVFAMKLRRAPIADFIRGIGHRRKYLDSTYTALFTEG